MWRFIHHLYIDDASPKNSALIFVNLRETVTVLSVVGTSRKGTEDPPIGNGRCPRVAEPQSVTLSQSAVSPERFQLFVEL
jgi:hypothetical protein